MTARSDISKLSRVLYDDVRGEIIEMLKSGEMCGREISNRLMMPGPTVSFHMRMLVDTGIVSSRCEGTKTFYFLNQEGGRRAAEILYSFLSF